MEAADRIRTRIQNEAEQRVIQHSEYEETQAVEFEQKVALLTSKIVEHDYARCFVYEWNGHEYVGMELFNYNGYDGRYEGLVLHLLLDESNQHIVVEAEKRKLENGYVIAPDTSYKNGGVNVIEGAIYDPRGPKHKDGLYDTQSSNMDHINSVLKYYPLM